MNQQFINSIETHLSSLTGKNVLCQKLRPLAGGCINNGFEVVTDAGSFFVKTNSATRYPGMFEAEAKGLQILRSTGTIRLPNPLCTGIVNNEAFLILEFIHSAPQKKDYWDDFGQKLARLHQHTQPTFGLDHDNYIGSLPQSNKQHHSLIEFLVSERFEPLVKNAREQGLIESALVHKFERLYHRIEYIVPDEQPALLHGDLWSGNVMTDHDGSVCLIDPAVYYGHREAELAFTTLFGAFSERFYNSYHAAFPLESDWKKRIDFWNIYPLLVHLLLFGSSYYGSLKASVVKYI